MKRAHEEHRPINVLPPQALNNTNTTSGYLKADGFPIDFLLFVSPMAATKTAKIELYQATDRDGTGAKLITDQDATITANTAVDAATVDLTAVGTGDTVAVNGTTFTKAGSTVVASRTYADAAGLVTCINDETYGVEGVTASANGAVVTVKSTDPGRYAVTMVGGNVGGTVVVATLSATALVSLDTDAMDTNNDFAWIAGKVTTTANTTVGVMALRGERVMPALAVADTNL